MIPGSQWKTWFFLAKHRMIKPGHIRWYKRLLAQQYLSPDELEELNWAKRKRLLEYAYGKVPFYRNRFRELGLAPEDLKEPEDFRQVPLLHKSDIRNHFQDLISEEATATHLRESTTGGSTGEPLKVLFDTRFPVDVHGWRFRSWWGVPPGVNEAVIARLPARSGFAERANAAMWLPTLRIRLDASSMSRKEINDFLRRFVRIRPGIVWGYVGAIAHVASVILERGLSVPAPRAVWVTSSPVTGVQREMIQTAFGAPAYDQYGCCEVFSLAAECRERNGMHIASDSRHVEFTNDGGDPVEVGASGSIVITDLENYYFPIIRYVNDDRGRALPGRCSCGVNLPLMDAVKGRESDMIRMPDGTCIAGDYLTTVFDDFPDAVLGFQVRQRSDHSIDLLYVPNPAVSDLDTVIEAVRRGLLQKTGSAVEVRLQAVGEIPHDRGKMRYIISDVG